jgi:hypothetical protein
VCVLDPEGDYQPLGRLRGVLALGGHNPLPRPDGIARLVEHRFGSVVIDLSLVGPSDRDIYARELLEQLARERAATGLPHWIVVDEAHLSFGGAARESAIPPGSTGYCLVTYQPSELAKEVWKALDFLLVLPSGLRRGPLGTNPVEAVEKAWPCRLAPAVDAARFGEAVLVRRASSESPRALTIGPRTTWHVRHWHKYAHAPLPAKLRFHFRDATGAEVAEASNVEEFHRGLAACSAQVVAGHAQRRDFSRWLREAIQDPELAAAVRDLEEDADASVGESEIDGLRGALLQALEERYLD